MKKILLSLALAALACFTAITVHATHYPPATAHAVKRIVHDAGHLYILYYDGVEIWDKTSGDTRCYRYGEGLFPSPTLNAIAVHEDTIWVGNGMGDLTAIHGTWSESWKIVFNPSVNEDTEDLQCWLGFNGIVFDSKGNLYFGGDNCVGMRTAPGEFSLYTLPGFNFGTEIWKMAVGNDDTVWLTATCAFLVNCLMSYSCSTGFGSVDLSGGPNIHPAHAKGLAVDAYGNKWFGGTISGEPSTPALFRYDGKGFEAHPLKYSDDKQEMPIDMGFDNHGRIWFIPTLSWNKSDNGFCAYSKGPLCCYDNGKLTEYPYYEPGMGYSYCLDVDEETVYIGTDKGVVVFDDGKFTQYNSEWNNESLGIESTIGATEFRPTYDLQGRRVSVSSVRPKGVYIQDGRKYVK